MRYTVHVGSEVRALDLEAGDADGAFTVTLGERKVPVVVRAGPDGALWLSIDGQHVEAWVRRERGSTDATVCLEGQAIAVTCRTGMEEQLAQAAAASGDAVETNVRTSMPGKVVEVKVKPGDVVKAGQRLLVLEAMKMENEILAKGAARVKTIHVAAGEAIESGALLMELERVEDGA